MSLTFRGSVFVVINTTLCTYNEKDIKRRDLGGGGAYLTARTQNDFLHDVKS